MDVRKTSARIDGIEGECINVKVGFVDFLKAGITFRIHYEPRFGGQ